MFIKSCVKSFTERDTKVYKCLTCDLNAELIICENCFINGKHYDHNYQSLTTISSGYCNCGDFNGLIYCTNHLQNKLISNTITFNTLYLNESLRKEFAICTGIDHKQVKVLSSLNQLSSLLNQSAEAVLVNKYFESSKALVDNGHRNIKLGKSYSVYRKDHEKRFVECGYDKQSRQLLWHGTKFDNLDGILRHGFKLSDKDNLLFGNGIYFADRVTNSCNYCDQNNNYGFLLLCEVATGVIFKTELPMKYVKPPDNSDSVQGIGKYIPEPNTSLLYNDIEIPIGKTIINRHKKTSLTELDFNEFVIYNPQKVLIKFIVQFEWI